MLYDLEDGEKSSSFMGQNVLIKSQYTNTVCSINVNKAINMCYKCVLKCLDSISYLYLWFHDT